MITQTQYPFGDKGSSDYMLPLAIVFGTALLLVAVKIHNDNKKDDDLKSIKN